MEGEALRVRLRSEFEMNFVEANAWHLQIGERGEMTRVAECVVQDAQPADWFMQRIEDWSFAHLPIEDKM